MATTRTIDEVEGLNEEDQADEVRLTILVLSGDRAAQLRACLESVARANLPARTEVLVALNGPQPTILPVLDDIRPTLPQLRVVEVARDKPGGARNVAVASARGRIVHFIDDDVTVNRWLFKHVINAFDADPGLGAVGGPNLTPLDSTLFQWTAGAVLGSIACALPVRRRYSQQPPRQVDERSLILCNLAVRRDLLFQVPFDATLFCAEENAFLRQAARRGEYFYYVPKAVVRHERRGTLRGHIQQMHKYGLGRGQLARRDFALSMLVYFLPLVGGVALTALAVAGLLGATWAQWAVAIPVLLYLAATGGTAAVIALRLKRPRAFPLALLLLPITHIAYAVGSARGLIRPRRPARRSQPEPESELELSPRA